MTISDKDMAHLQTLARIKVPADALEDLKNDLNAILGYFEQIRDLDTDGVEELTRPVPLDNVFRADELRPPLPVETVLGLAVEREGDFFKVPRTVDTGE